MQVTTRDGIAGTDRDKMVAYGVARVLRYLVESDGCGFSFSTLEIDGDLDGMELHYRHHVEANLVLAGTGELEALDTGEVWPLEPGTMYVVGPSDRHRVTMTGPVRVISIFNPPIAGDEQHVDGGYSASGAIPDGWDPAAGASALRMFVRHLTDVPPVVTAGGQVEARRYFVRSDRVGFSLSDVRTTAGLSADLWYKNHVEANFVLSGNGEVTDLSSGETWPLTPGTLYVVGPKDRHRVTSGDGLHILSVFNPPLEGDETYDADGGYAATGAVPPAWQG